MRSEKITDAIVLNELIFNNYIDGNFKNLNPKVLVWPKKSENPIINECLSVASKNLKENQGYPEYIIYDEEYEIVIVIEDKRDPSKHIYDELDKKISEYAVNGALWYASKLSKNFDVIAIGVSGNNIENVLVDTYAWRKQAETFTNLNTHKILQISKYRDIVKKSERDLQSIDEYKNLTEKANEINKFLRNYLGVVEHDRLYVLGSILFALEDPIFKMTYSGFNNNKDLAIYIYQTIERKTKNSGLQNEEIIQRELKPCIEGLGSSEKEGAKNKFSKGSLLELVKNVDALLYDYYKNSEIDLISMFFNIFLAYSTKGGSDLGIVLTPPHIAKLFSEIAEVNNKSKILDICVGTGSFLTAAWKKISLSDKYTFTEKENFRTHNLYGVEKIPSIYTIVALNMFINKDGRSNLYMKDCFSIREQLKSLDCNVGFINPPYSDEIYSEISFTELMLDSLLPNSIGIAILPVNSTSSRTKKHNNLNMVKQRILKKHSLLASIQMPNQLFYPKGTETVILIFRTGVEHNNDTWFALFDDGFELVKHQKTRTPTKKALSKMRELLESYKTKKVGDNSFTKKISYTDQWVYLLHKKSTYEIDFMDLQNTVNEYVSYLINNRYLLSQSNTKNKSNFQKIEYSLVNLTDYFTILPPKQTDKMNLELSSKEERKSIPFLGRKQTNNGISDYVIFDENSYNKGNVITIALDGSTGSTFYQHHGFCSGQNIWLLKKIDAYIKELNPLLAMFFITSISKSVKAYSYNLSLTKTRLQNIKILLPINNDKSVDTEAIYKVLMNLNNTEFLNNIPNERY